MLSRLAAVVGCLSLLPLLLQRATSGVLRLGTLLRLPLATLPAAPTATGGHAPLRLLQDVLPPLCLAGWAGSAAGAEGCRQWHSQQPLVTAAEPLPSHEGSEKRAATEQPSTPPHPL